MLFYPINSMTTTLNITGQLEALIGAEFVHVSEDTITVTPANTQQVSEILRYANENNLTVTPTGGSTKQSWGNEIQPNPTKTNIRLALTRLNRVIEHPWQDLTCTVQAGCTWQQLQQTLAKHGQFVALDPLWPERATVGGILATNDSGALRHRYGSLRDLVIGMTLVLADGTIARSGGKVVKNVAGYDLCKLVTGSFGTLAIITEATFRLHPLPQHVQTFTVAAPQAPQLAPLMQSIRASHLLTQALQLRGDTNGFHLDIQLNAHPEAKQSEILQKMTEGAGLKLNESLATIEQRSPAQSHSQAEPFAQTQMNQIPFAEPLAPASHIAPKRDDGASSGLQAAETKPESERGFSPGPFSAREMLFQDNVTVIKLSVLPSELGEYLDHMQRAPEVEIICVAQSSGLIFAALEGASEAIKKYLQSIKTNLTILTTPTNARRWKADPNTLPLMQAVKHQFDPKRTLNPGRFLGGI
jgi:FAD/FMN-containing dehydrogenase